MRQILACGALLAFLAISMGARANENTVEVGHNHLSPSEVSIATGEEVTFHNRDEMPGGHTIVADDGSFSSPPLAKEESWSHKFETPGTHSYHIKEHPGARGTIIVK